MNRLYPVQKGTGLAKFYIYIIDRLTGPFNFLTWDIMGMGIYIYIYLSCQQQSTLGTQQSKLVQSAKLGRPQSNSKDGSEWPPVPKVWSYTFLFTAFNSKISRVESI